MRLERIFQIENKFFIFFLEIKSHKGLIVFFIGKVIRKHQIY
jgi:hypothetical protein